MLEAQHKEKQQEDESLAGKIPLQRHRKLPELQGRRRLCRPLAKEVWRGDPCPPPPGKLHLEVPARGSRWTLSRVLGISVSPHRWGHPAQTGEVPPKIRLETNILIASCLPEQTLNHPASWYLEQHNSCF